jgi:hypothetical protein
LLERRLAIGERFTYRDPETGNAVTVCVMGIRPDGYVDLGIEADGEIQPLVPSPTESIDSTRQARQDVTQQRSAPLARRERLLSRQAARQFE